MGPGTVHELSEHERLILDLEKTTHTVAARDALCRRINLPVEKYAVVLKGLVDTDAGGTVRVRTPARPVEVVHAVVHLRDAGCSFPG